MYEEENTAAEQALEDAIASATDDGLCLFDSEEECLIHHSYESKGGKCLWAEQHINEDRKGLSDFRQ